jgi:outer membrane protein assembly factor BamB/DNA-directed RNA polymerase subunit RPC12/RpoP
MPQAVSIRCPHCNAALSVDPAARGARCEYCGTPVLLKHTQAPVPRTPVPRTDVPAPPRRPAPPPQWQGGRRVSRWLIATPLLLAIAGGVMSAGIFRSAQPVVPGTVPSSPVPVVAGPTERLSWDMTTSMATVRLNSDAIDDLLVFVAVYAGNENPLRLAAIDGASGERLWMTESYGTISTHNAHVHTELAVQGNLVLVTDHRRTAHVLDLTTGSELRAATLTDRAEWVCADPESDSQVWIEVADDQHVRMDLTTAAVTPAPERPDYCPPWHERVDCRDYKGSVRCARDSDRPNRIDLDGFYAEGVLSIGAERVAVGYKSPGTRLPMAAAYRKGARKPHWVRRLIEDQDAPVQEGAPGHYDVAGGRLVMHYEVGNEEHRLMALDTATGKTLWDLALPRDGDRELDVRAVIASETRVFVLNYEVVLRVDAATGQLLNQPAD